MASIAESCVPPDPLNTTKSPLSFPSPEKNSVILTPKARAMAMRVETVGDVLLLSIRLSALAETPLFFPRTRRDMFFVSRMPLILTPILIGLFASSTLYLCLTYILYIFIVYGMSSEFRHNVPVVYSETYRTNYNTVDCENPDRVTSIYMRDWAGLLFTEENVRSYLQGIQDACLS